MTSIFLKVLLLGTLALSHYSEYEKRFSPFAALNPGKRLVHGGIYNPQKSYG
jgi:hypothetical protein